jgi:hypothetical protein
VREWIKIEGNRIITSDDPYEEKGIYVRNVSISIKQTSTNYLYQIYKKLQYELKVEQNRIYLHSIGTTKA